MNNNHSRKLLFLFENFTDAYNVFSSNPPYSISSRFSFTSQPLVLSFLCFAFNPPRPLSIDWIVCQGSPPWGKQEPFMAHSSSLEVTLVHLTHTGVWAD